MPYKILLRRDAQKELDKIAEKDFNPLEQAISKLEHEPMPFGTKKLTGHDLWRIRIGDFRIIYSIDDIAYIITIVRIARRNEQTYKQLK